LAELPQYYAPATRTVQAHLYEYNYRPYEEKNVKARKEREQQEKMAKGILDPPSTITNRQINKLFDSRKSHIVPENLRPMPMPDGQSAPPTRDQVMALGKYTAGGLRKQYKDKFESIPCPNKAK
jgi:hypothetical protein